MKNRKVLLLVIAIGVLVAILLLNRKKSEALESSDAASQESAQNLPAEAQAPVEPAVSSPSEEAATTPADTVDTTQKKGVSESSEEVASKIQKNLAGARKILQQKAVIEKSRSEDLHHMPKVTLDAARRLGEIAELEAAHPEQAESFREFYLECARDDRTMTVTRAQCLDRYLKASKLDAAAQKQLLAEFPESIVRLVEALQ